MASSTWINTGEGGVADVHLATGVVIVSQIGPGLFGFRDDTGRFSITNESGQSFRIVDLFPYPVTRAVMSDDKNGACCSYYNVYRGLDS